MSRDGAGRFDPCAPMRAAIHRRLDGETLAPGERSALDRHLALCPSCRDVAADLANLVGTLRELSPAPLPEAALDEVWRRTSRPAPSPWRAALGAWLDLRVAAALAAALALATFAGWHLHRESLAPAPGSATEAAPTPEELSKAAADVRLALRLAGRALERGERTVVRRVIAGEIGPALERLPVRSPAKPAPPALESSKGGRNDA